MSLNAVGIHIIGGSNLPLTNGAAKPHIIKLVDCSVQYMRDVRALVGPDCLIVIRWYDASQDINLPYAAAQAWFNKHLADIEAIKGKNVVIEGFNEISDSQAVLYSAFELYRGQFLHGIGAGCCYLSSSVGCPREDVWPTHQAWLDDMKPGDVVGLHEYWSDIADIDNKWHCARWQLISQLNGKPIAVTECGRDIVENKGAAGWQKTTDANGFYTDLGKYSSLIGKYPNVRGATVFQVGSRDSQWTAFDVTSLWGRVVAEYSATASTPPIILPVIPPVKVPAPIPAPVKPKLVIDGRCLNEQQFKAHVQGLKFDQGFTPTRVYLHHTFIPNLSTWKGGETIEAMRRTYEGYGWTSGPHLFVATEGIWLFSPLNNGGTAVKDNNFGSIHLEMVGNYNEAVPSGAVLELTLWALTQIFRRTGLAWRGLLFHRDSDITSCPGTAIGRTWFLAQLEKMMGLWGGLPEEETATDAYTLVTKIRAWQEEIQRCVEAGFIIRANDIRVSLIQLLYRVENMLAPK